MARSRVVWNPDPDLAKKQVVLARAMDGIVKDLATLITKAVSRGQPTVRTARGEMRGLDPSKPGEPPKVVSGKLRQSWDGTVSVTSQIVRGRVASSDDPQKVFELEFKEGEMRGVSGMDRPHVRVNLWSENTKASVRRHLNRAGGPTASAAAKRLLGG